jgi:hypothetical protein
MVSRRKNSEYKARKIFNKVLYKRIMRKKTSIAIGLVIATILIAYISAITLSNQAFAQVHVVMPGKTPYHGFHTFTGIHISQPGDMSVSSHLFIDEKQVGKTLAQDEAQVGKVLAHDEAQAGKVLAGGIVKSIVKSFLG